MSREAVFGTVFRIAAFGDQPPEKDAIFNSIELTSETSDRR